MISRRAALFERSDIVARRFMSGSHLEIFHRADQAGLTALLGELGHLAAIVGNLARQPHPFAEFALAEVGVGDIGDQRQTERALRFLAGQIAGQSGFVEAAHATPEIQLIVEQLEADVIALHREWTTKHIEIGRGQAGLALAEQFQLRQLGGTLDAIQRTGFGDVRRGDAQVAVVFQRLGDQGLQARIGKILAPVGQCGGLAAGVGAAPANQCAGRLSVGRR